MFKVGINKFKMTNLSSNINMCVKHLEFHKWKKCARLMECKTTRHSRKEFSWDFNDWW